MPFFQTTQDENFGTYRKKSSNSSTFLDINIDEIRLLYELISKKSTVILKKINQLLKKKIVNFSQKAHHQSNNIEFIQLAFSIEKNHDEFVKKSSMNRNRITAISMAFKNDNQIAQQFHDEFVTDSNFVQNNEPSLFTQRHEEFIEKFRFIIDRKIYLKNLTNKKKATLKLKKK